MEGTFGATVRDMAHGTMLENRSRVCRRAMRARLYNAALVTEGRRRSARPASAAPFPPRQPYGFMSRVSGFILPRSCFPKIPAYRPVALTRLLGVVSHLAVRYYYYYYRYTRSNMRAAMRTRLTLTLVAWGTKTNGPTAATLRSCWCCYLLRHVTLTAGC